MSNSKRNLTRYQDTELENVANDLISRFLMFLPDHEKKPPRIFQHLIEAHWFYSDFLAKNNCKDEKINEDTKFSILPQMKEKEFMRFIIERTPFLRKMMSNFYPLYDDFKNYQSKIPRFGGIILNEDLTKVLLVVSFNGGYYDFPKGKVDENEQDEECAIREVEEEIGFDIASRLNPDDFIVRWNGNIMLHTGLSEFEPVNTDAKFNKYVKLFLITGVPETQKFEIRTRKEIQRIEWVDLNFLQRTLIEEDHNKKYSSIRPCMFLVTKFVAFLQGKIPEDAMKNNGALGDEEYSFQMNDMNNLGYIKKGKNLHFVEQDYDRAYKFYQKAIESYDNAINALEFLFSLVIQHRGGIPECLDLLHEYRILFHNINDYKKHISTLKSIQASLDSESSSGDNIVIEAVYDQFNIEYPMIKEITFRMGMHYSYQVEQVNQIFIDKDTLDPTKFISNETMAQQVSKYGRDVVNKFHCYRMMYFYTEEAAGKYFKRHNNGENYIYIMNSKNIRIDGLDGEEFKTKQFEVLRRSEEAKMHKKMQSQREVEKNKQKKLQKQKNEEVKKEEKEPVLKLKVSNQTLQKKPVQPKVVEEVPPSPAALSLEDQKDIEDAVKDSMIGVKSRLMAQLQTLRISRSP